MKKKAESALKKADVDLDKQMTEVDASLEKIVEDINATNAVAKGKSGKKQEIFQFLKFLGFSLSAGVIQIGLFELLCHVIGWYYWPSYLISLVASVVWNFTFNRKFTFKSANNVPIAMALVLAYYAVFTPLSTWWSDALVKSAGWNETLVTLFSMVINFVTEFLFDRFVVFRKSINTNGNKTKKKCKEKSSILVEESVAQPQSKMDLGTVTKLGDASQVTSKESAEVLSTEIPIQSQKK